MVDSDICTFNILEKLTEELVADFPYKDMVKLNFSYLEGVYVQDNELNAMQEQYVHDISDESDKNDYYRILSLLYNPPLEQEKEEEIQVDEHYSKTQKEKSSRFKIFLKTFVEEDGSDTIPSASENLKKKIKKSDKNTNKKENKKHKSSFKSLQQAL